MPLLGQIAEGGVELVAGMTLFVIAGAAMGVGALVAGRFLRPRLPHPEKDAPYECGEPAMGSGWVQFDLRFYVVALVFLVFDIEIALFYPWAVVFGTREGPGVSAEAARQVKLASLYDMLFFFGVIVVGFLYLWRFGYLDWVRAYAAAPERPVVEPPPPPSGKRVADAAR